MKNKTYNRKKDLWSSFVCAMLVLLGLIGETCISDDI